MPVKSKDALISMADKIWEHVRNEIYLSMPFMGPALTLPFVADLRTRTLGCDGVSIRYNPRYVIDLFGDRYDILKRSYMQMIIHCIFCHMYKKKRFEDGDLYNLCCDIAAESIIDSMDYPVIYRLTSDFREETYKALEGLGVLTAPVLYRHFTDGERDYIYESRLWMEFSYDDHIFWDMLPEDEGENKGGGSGANPKEMEKQWQDRAKGLLSAIAGGREASLSKGTLYRLLKLEYEKKSDYRDYLARFSVIREETHIDPDSFDYGYYMYGLSLYENMPLIEENEYRERRGVEELVIAIDTSASCQRELLQEFLNETAAVLLSSNEFFGRVSIYIIECDNQIQKTLHITDVRQMEDYLEGFETAGGYGTDFRPVFSHVKDLKKRGFLRDLKGLFYFTDGEGTFPREGVGYETVFVLPYRDESQEKSPVEIPSWAGKCYYKSAASKLKSED